MATQLVRPSWCHLDMGRPAKEGRVSGLRVLIVEDEPSLRSLLKTALELFGHTVVVAQDGAEALEVCFAPTSEIDVVLMDVKMPTMDGLEATRMLRADPRTSGMAIVMVSGLAMECDIREGMQAGADAYVVKPFELRAITELVSRCRRREAAATT